MREDIEIGEIRKVKIEERGEKGDGIAKINGMVVFVPNAKVGKEYKIKIKNVKPRFAFAEIIA